MTAATLDRPPMLPARPRVALRTHRRTRRRTVLVGVALAAAVFVAFCVSVSVGDFPIPLRDVVPAIFGFGSPDSDFIVRELRLPRALAGLLVGAAFGLSGALFQCVARNPLASPDIIGIEDGAGAAAVAAIVLWNASTSNVAFAAFGGALVAATAIYLLAYQRGISPYRFVLVGIGVGAMLSAITAYLLTRAEIFEAQRAAVWLVGSLNGRSWDQVRLLAIAMVVLVPAALALARPLRALQLGDDTAVGLGAPVRRARVGVLVVGVGLSAFGTATAGPIAFVAFIGPAIARRLTRSSFTLIPSALSGALLLLVSDLAARQVMSPSGLPVGVVTGIIGGPYLLYLLARANKVGSGG